MHWIPEYNLHALVINSTEFFLMQYVLLLGFLYDIFCSCATLILPEAEVLNSQVHDRH